MSYQQNPQQHQYGSPAQNYQQPPPGYGGAPPPGGAPPAGYQQQQQQQQHGGYGQAPPPPTGNPSQQLWGWFKAVDTDNSGQLTVDELQRALINGDWSPFNIETVRLMVAMFDKDQTGTIDFQEFSGLWKYIEDWKRCFQTFDADGSGSIDRSEMGNALRTFGYNLSDKFINILINKFDKYGHWSAGKGDVTFDNFVQASVTVKTLTDSFRQYDTDGDGWIQIKYEDFLELVVRQRG
ncbi:hypothetical protein INT45_012218 [Circinella minor]|uniref:EF-hand domain-containing protein n=1 Tax=Circinella minor TaxID=1195481 RepID=A0A8H7VIE9_9FUNG|nr:hypothetical protein INT45_012218 [Circinella minor]